MRERESLWKLVAKCTQQALPLHCPQSLISSPAVLLLVNQQAWLACIAAIYLLSVSAARSRGAKWCSSLLAISFFVVVVCAAGDCCSDLLSFFSLTTSVSVLLTIQCLGFAPTQLCSSFHQQQQCWWSSFATTEDTRLLSPPHFVHTAQCLGRLHFCCYCFVFSVPEAHTVHCGEQLCANSGSEGCRRRSSRSIWRRGHWLTTAGVLQSKVLTTRSAKVKMMHFGCCCCCHCWWGAYR